MAIFSLNSLSEEEKNKYLKQIEEEERQNRQVEENRRIEANRAFNKLNNANISISYDNNKSDDTNTWFNHNNLFSNGYDFGDVSKTLGGTALDIFSGIYHGVSNLGENMSDFLTNRLADIAELTGHTERANIARNNAIKDDSQYDFVGQTFDKLTESSSLLGNKIDNVNQGIGYSAMLGAISLLPGGQALTAGTTFSSAAGSGETEAYNEQYQKAVKNGFTGSFEDYLKTDEGKETIKNSRLYGALTGATETITENIAGGLGKASGVLGISRGYGELDDKLGQALAKKFKSQVAKNLVEYGVKSAGEGTEEIASGLANALWQKITYKKGEKYWDLVKEQNIPESALSATISSAIMQSPEFVQSTRASRDFISGMTQNEENVYNQILSDKQNQLMRDKTINNEIDTKYKDLTDEEKTQKYQELSTAYDNYDIKPTKLTRDEIEQTENEAYQEMYNQINNQNNSQADEQNLLNNEQQNTNSVNDFQVKNANDTDDYNSTIAYQYQNSDNEKIDQLRQDIVNNTNWNNSEKTHNYVNMLEKIITDKDIAIKIDGNLQDDKGRVANGSYSNGVITINPNSDRAGEFLAIHELTHAIGTNDMMNIVKKYMQDNKEFGDNVQSLLQTYNKSEIDEEALADVSGQLFGTQEFINNIAQTKPNVFKRIYNEIKYLYHQFTGYKNQDQFVNDLYNKWTEAYNSNKQLNDNESFLKAKLDNGESTVVSEDINGTNPTDREAKRSLENMLGIKYINEGNSKEISIENKDIGKYLHDGYNNYKSARLKKRIAGNYGEIIEIAKEDIQASKPNYKGSNRGKQGFDYYNVNLTYPIRDANGNIVDYKNYEARLVVRKDNGGNFAYDLDNFSIKNGATLDKSSLSIASDKSDSGSSNKSIPPTQQNVNDNTKYSIQESENNSGSFSMDNQGRKLSKEQQEYFKNSKVRDENNNLLTMYHSTDSDFNTFSYDNLGKTGLAYGEGFYFTDSEKAKNAYGNNTKTVYLDISKPMEIGKRTMTKNDFRKLAEAVNKKTNGQLEADYGSIDDAVQSYEYGGDDIDLVNELKNESGLSNAEYYNLLRDTLGYDGIKANNKSNGEDGNYWIAFNSNQIKNIDNTNPTSNPDIRYSKGNQSWREYLEKNFKTEGTTTKFSELEINNNQQKQEILNKAKQVEQINPDFKGLSDDIKNNYLDNKDYKLEDVRRYLDDILNKFKKNTQESQENNVNTILKETTYKEDAQRKKDYMKFKNDNTAYKTEEVNNALMSIQANRNGKRTVNQWKEVANQIGQQLAINNRNENYVQRIAFKSWFDLQPNTKESITRYDNQTKQNQSFQKFTSDDWVNTIYKSYKEQLQNMNLNVKNSVESQTTIKQSAQNNNNPNINTPGEMVDYSQMERPTEGKQRKFYKSIIESSNTTAEAKKISKELIGYDTYVPTSNVQNLKEADSNINTNGTENSLTALNTKVNNNEKITATDVATGERLIEYYSKVGDKEHLQEAIQTTALAGTQAGQAVQAFALLNRMTPQGQVTYIQRSINKINKKLEDKYNKSLFKGNKELKQFDFTPEMQQEILNANGKAELESAIDDVYRQLGQQVSKSSIEKIDAWRYFSMLGNPRTHIRNMVGNKAMEGLQGIKNKVAGAIEDAVLGNQDVEHTHTLKRASKETIAFAKNDINNVKLELGLGDNKYNSQSMLSKYQNTFENKALQNTFGKLMNLNDKLLEAEDGLGLKSNYVKSLSNYLTANNLDVNNISDKQLQKARNHAIKEAQEATFHQDCYIASAINTIENKNLATKVAFGSVLPFKKTPINIATTAFEYNPAGLAKTITYDSVQLRKGNINVNQYIDNLSKGLTGTGVALLGFALAQSGIIKASGGDDDKKEDFEEGQGKQSYSITIGDHTYSLDWLAPTGIPFFVGSELYSMANKKAGGTDEKGASANQLFKSATNILNAVATSANPLSEMSMISGLTSALQSYGKDNKALENMALNAGKSYINQFVPTSLGQVAKTLDTKERSTTSTASDPLAKNIDSLANQVKSKIPGLRETLPTKTDTWGNEINQEGNVAQRFLNNAIAPWSKKQITTNETDSKLAKLYDETGNSSVLPKNSINNTLTIDKQKYRLSNDEYSRLKKMYGETNYNILNDLMKSESFQSLDNEQKSKAVEKVYSYSQALVKSQYADMNDISTEDAKIVQKVQNIAKWGGKASDYFNFSGGSTDEETSNEKATRLKAMDISNKSKEAIYYYDFGQKDKNFSSINKIGVDIDDYLDFKSQRFENDESYTTKEQYMDYLDEANMSLKDKELLFSTKYTLNEEQKDELFDYIDNSSLNRAEKLELFKNLKGFKVLENGNISY